MEEDEDIAAAMGFSSFGGTKKRKFDQTNSPRTKPDASGANSIRLGVRPKTVADGEGIEEDTIAETIESTDSTGNASQSQAHPSTSKTNTKGKKKPPPPATGLAAFLALGQNLPDKSLKDDENPGASPAVQEDSSATTMVSFGGPPISQAELNALRNGVQVENGDTAYFLPSFVEDPWTKR